MIELNHIDPPGSHTTPGAVMRKFNVTVVTDTTHTRITDHVWAANTTHAHVVARAAVRSAHGEDVLSSVAVEA